MGTVRVRDTPLDHLLARRAAERRKVVVSQVDQAIAALRAAGVDAEVVGSLARGEFRADSDVDILVHGVGRLSETQVFSLICDHLKAAPFDLIFADRLSRSSLEIMRQDAQVRS